MEINSWQFTAKLAVQGENYNQSQEVKRFVSPVLQLCIDLSPNTEIDSWHGIERSKDLFYYQEFTTKKANVTVAHLNVHSIISCENFYVVTETIKENNYYIFTISESWLGSSTSFLDIHIPRYLLFQQDRGEHKCGGGLLVYIKDIYKASTINHLSSVSETDFQQL